MTMPANGQPDPNAQPSGEPNGDPAGQPDPNAQTDAPKSVEDQLAELTEKFEYLKKHSRTWEQRAKENRDKAKAYDDLQAANATPDQRLQAAEEKAAQAERELARFRVAQRTKLDLDLVELLNGDEDAMEEQAKKLLARLVPAKPERQTPKPDQHQGGSGNPQKPSQADEGRAEAQRRIAARKKS